MEKTVEIDEQWSVMRAMQELTMDPTTGTAGGEGEIPSKVGPLGKLFDLVGGDCLEKLGLYRKQESSDDEEEIDKGNDHERVDVNCRGVVAREETVGYNPRKDQGGGNEQAHCAADEVNVEDNNGGGAQEEVSSSGNGIGDGGGAAGGGGEAGEKIRRDLGNDVVLPDEKQQQEGEKTAQGPVEQKPEVEDGEIG
ncbi:hypothetical protein CBR_g41324 [Chara braunii]|uniref:Uncharacterized protein n=1 Tax=Chara braunii TaxID=69332 RepID=A0A388LVP7_CHABU|nr:hypothetical protein CBR_g41324 [Chara braunii]|eukprot:GBG86331.1 hypothetical protein CBR_g41324 [Chara braunii]